MYNEYICTEDAACKMLSAALSSIKLVEDFSITLHGNVYTLETKINHILMNTIKPFLDIHDASKIFTMDIYKYDENKNIKLLHFDESRINNRTTLPYKLKYEETDISSMCIRTCNFSAINYVLKDNKDAFKYQLNFTQIYDRYTESLDKIFIEYMTIEQNSLNLLFDILKNVPQIDLNTLHIKSMNSGTVN